MGIFEKQERTTFKAIALREIRKALLNGKLQPGDRIIEQEISNSLGISRFPVREALSSLEKAGLLVSIPFKGTYVAKVNEKDLEEIYIVRTSLEQLAVKLLIDDVSSSKIRLLESITAEMEDIREDNITEFFMKDMAFHQAICELTQNGKLLEMWVSLKDQLLLLVSTRKHYYSKPKEMAQSHKIILDSIRIKDVDLASRLVSEHISEALIEIKEIMEQAGTETVS